MIGDVPRFKRHVIKVDAGNHDFVALRSESTIYHSIIVFSNASIFKFSCLQQTNFILFFTTGK